MLGKFRSLLFVCILSTLFLCLLRVELVYAEIASGTSGTCSWVIDDDGVLTISPTDGVNGVLSPGVGPWYNSYSTVIRKVIVNSGVKVAEQSSSLFYVFLREYLLIHL